MQALKAYSVILVPTVSHSDCSSNLSPSQKLGEVWGKGRASEELGCSCRVCLSDQPDEVMDHSLPASFGPVAQ